MKEIVDGFINREGNIFEFGNSQEEGSCTQSQVLQMIDNSEVKAHRHEIGEINGLQSALEEIESESGSGDGLTRSEIEELIGETQPAQHTHSSIASALADILLSAENSDGNIVLQVTDKNGEKHNTTITPSNISNLDLALKVPSSTPENNANKLITSKAVYDALSNKMDKKTVDSVPADNADHLISSKAVFDIINSLTSRIQALENISLNENSNQNVENEDWIEVDDIDAIDQYKYNLSDHGYYALMNLPNHNQYIIGDKIRIEVYDQDRVSQDITTAHVVDIHPSGPNYVEFDVNFADIHGRVVISRKPASTSELTSLQEQESELSEPQSQIDTTLPSIIASDDEYNPTVSLRMYRDSNRASETIGVNTYYLWHGEDGNNWYTEYEVESIAVGDSVYSENGLLTLTPSFCVYEINPLVNN